MGAVRHLTGKSVWKPVTRRRNRVLGGDRVQRRHDKIIAAAAKGPLVALGLVRRGESRIWLADHRWWLAVVEFQPSSWSKGSYLNVAAHWLWSSSGVISFDYGGRTGGFVEFQNDSQFTADIIGLVDQAANAVKQLEDQFFSLSATATVLSTGAQTGHLETNPGHPGWTEFNAGVALALDGREQDAAAMFDAIRSSPTPPGSVLHIEAERFARIVSDQAQLRREIRGLIDHQRSALRLAPLDGPPF